VTSAPVQCAALRSAASIHGVISARYGGRPAFGRAHGFADFVKEGGAKERPHHGELNSSTVWIDDTTKLDAHRNAITASTYFMFGMVAQPVAPTIPHHESKPYRFR
jgi:hypothetical protein